ncbi:MAG: 30S ribosomal protein S6 [Ignavibacteriales bacterium]|nr:30S ribosomal protein S6 [Ignavibacteriales bacterium]
MKKQTYESAVLINAALDDEQIDQILSKIKDNITNNGGEVLEIDNWGRKRLAYTVKKNKIGYYAIFRFIAQPSIVAKLERLYTLDENILRFLTISLTKEALEQIEINKAKVIAETEEVIVPEVVPEVLEGEGDEE